MPIPTKKKEATFDPWRMKAILYGDPKLGKSTFVSKIPNSIVLATDDGWDALSGMLWQDTTGKWLIDSWKTLWEAAKEVVESGKFKTLIIDSIDLALVLATEYVREKYSVEFLNDGKLSYGKGNELVARETIKLLHACRSTGMGVWLTSHPTTEEIALPNGVTYTTTLPSLPDRPKRGQSPRSMIIGWCDFILYAALDPVKDGTGAVTGYTRRIHSQRTWQYEAGDRTGKIPDPLPLDIKAFQQCFAATKQEGKK